MDNEELSKEVISLRKQLSEQMAFFGNLFTLGYKMDEVEFAIKYANANRDFEDMQLVVKAFTQFHKKLKPIIKKAKEAEDD